MDTKTIVIIVLAILLTLWGWYIVNDKYKEFKQELAVNLYNAGYKKWILDIIELSDKKVKNQCKDPIIPLFSGNDTINLVDTRCLSDIFQKVQKQQWQQSKSLEDSQQWLDEDKEEK